MPKKSEPGTAKKMLGVVGDELADIASRLGLIARMLRDEDNEDDAGACFVAASHVEDVCRDLQPMIAEPVPFDTPANGAKKRRKARAPKQQTEIPVIADEEPEVEHRYANSEDVA